MIPPRTFQFAKKKCHRVHDRESLYPKHATYSNALLAYVKPATRNPLFSVTRIPLEQV
jgi:hypothetical protein